MKTAQMLEMKILLLHGRSNGFRFGFRVEGWGCDINLHGRLSKVWSLQVVWIHTRDGHQTFDRLVHILAVH